MKSPHHTPYIDISEVDPTHMCRLDFPVETLLISTGKRVHEVFPDSDDGTGKIKENEIFFDPDGVGSLIEIDEQEGKINIFMSLLLRGVIPTAEVISLPDSKKKKKSKYYSLAFDPEKIEKAYTEAEYFAGISILEAFGDGDHYYFPEDAIIRNTTKKGNRHYFYDFQLAREELPEFPPTMIPHGGYAFIRKDVREAFFRMVGELHDRYSGEGGKRHFFAIGKKAGIPEKNISLLWERISSRIHHLYSQYKQDPHFLDTWEAENKQYIFPQSLLEMNLS